jgi:hypothetical protein
MGIMGSPFLVADLNDCQNASLAPGTAKNTAQYTADDLASNLPADGTCGTFDQLLACAGAGASSAAAQEVAEFVQNAALRGGVRRTRVCGWVGSACCRL